VGSQSGCFALTGVDDSGDGGLIAGRDRVAEGEQDAGARGGGQGRHPDRLGALAVVAGSGQGE
jgi:hypothetical protein